MPIARSVKKRLDVCEISMTKDRPLHFFFKLADALKYRLGVFRCDNLVHLPLAVGDRVVPDVGKLGLGAYDLFYLINVFDIYKVYTAANVGYFYKDGIHAQK